MRFAKEINSLSQGTCVQTHRTLRVENSRSLAVLDVCYFYSTFRPYFYFARDRLGKTRLFSGKFANVYCTASAYLHSAQCKAQVSPHDSPSYRRDKLGRDLSSETRNKKRHDKRLNLSLPFFLSFQRGSVFCAL